MGARGIEKEKGECRHEFGRAMSEGDWTIGIERECVWAARERKKKIGHPSGLRGSRVTMRDGGNRTDSGRIGCGWAG